MGVCTEFAGSSVTAKKLKRLDAPEQVSGPRFADGEGWPPEGEDLRALVDAFETLFGFRDSLNRRDPELLGAWSVESHANALPAVFNAGRGAGQAAAKRQVLRAGRCLEKTIGLGGSQEIQHGLDADGQGAIEGDRQRDF